ncbi:MAG: 4-hydroxy-3-methylbut-2-enyl diphosphate reductase [Bacteroidales bacterium]|nr:4-hydroxy-3-methylbut-2-enyl diphosphate reductase [Bacteroidales bacterium]
MTKIEIDNNSGFCFGVEAAIKKAEEELKKGTDLYCLGQIVHNDMEVKRLENMGMKTIDYETYKKIKNANVLLRAHGEAPETYEIAKKNDIHLIDATCPIVTKFQQRIKKTHNEAPERQIVIYGQEKHPEIIGLSGQIGFKAIIVENENDLHKIDFNKPLKLFSQTTKSALKYQIVADKIEKKANAKAEISKTLCRAVSGREPDLEIFAKKYDTIVFVSGKNSSNGKMLYNVCLQNNPKSYFITSVDELKPEWFKDINSIGITGATSTPKWLMEKVQKTISALFNK